jgi:peroxiredoxin
MQSRGCLVILALILASCQSPLPLDRKFPTVEGKEIRLDSALRANEGLVLFYLSPECPLCQNYTVTISKLKQEFEKRDLAFYGVVSGNYYSKSDVQGYLLRYELDLPIVMDQEFTLANYYGASITPEAHLIGSDGEAKYRGAIDNWAITLGQKRLTITEYYLKNAMTAYLESHPIDPDQTDAVGCYIE